MIDYRCFGTFSTSSAWHAYNVTKYNNMLLTSTSASTEANYRHNENHYICPSFYSATKPLSIKLINKMKLWSTLYRTSILTNQLNDQNQTLYGLEEALQVIWKNQFPRNCRDKNQKYIIAQIWPTGMGSMLHVLGLFLGAAIDLNRILIPVWTQTAKPKNINIGIDYDEAVGTICRTPFCYHQNKTDLSCYYEDFSSCNRQDAFFHLNETNTSNYTVFSLSKIITSLKKNSKELLSSIDHHRIIVMTFDTISITNRNSSTNRNLMYDFIPHKLLPLVNCSPMKTKFLKYWWRAVSITFLIRPNTIVREQLAKYRMLSDLSYHDIVIGN